MMKSASSSALSRWAAFSDLRQALVEGQARVEASGLWGASRALVLGALVETAERPALVITAGSAERHRAALDLGFFLSASTSAGGGPVALDRRRVLEVPPAESGAWRSAVDREQAAEHALCCHRLLRGDTLPIVTTPAALSAPLLTPAEFRARSSRFVVGESLPREDLLQLLEWAGYERVETVTEVGQWSLREGIIDVFSPASAAPVRAEFFGDEVESLRLFDPTTQRSVEAITELDVLPLLAKDVETCALTAYLPATTLVALHDPAVLDAPPDDAPAAQPLDALLEPYQRLEMPLLPRRVGAAARFDMGTRSVGGVRGQFKALAEEIREWRGEGFTVRLVVDDERQADRLRQ